MAGKSFLAVLLEKVFFVLFSGPMFSPDVLLGFSKSLFKVMRSLKDEGSTAELNSLVRELATVKLGTEVCNNEDSDRNSD